MLVAAGVLVVFGALTAARLPVDVFPDLNRPTVTIMTEAEGLAPQEVEQLVTYPIETQMNGLPGVTRVRSVSGVGLSIVYVEFAWGTDIFRNRQQVAERLQLVQSQLPANTAPQMGPINSIMGQILLVAMTAPEGVSPMSVREIADFVVRPRLLTIPGVAQVIPMGGEVRQYRVAPNPAALRAFGVTYEQLEKALAQFGGNTGGGFTDQYAQEFLIRNIGRTLKLEDLRQSRRRQIRQPAHPSAPGGRGELRRAHQARRCRLHGCAGRHRLRREAARRRHGAPHAGDRERAGRAHARRCRTASRPTTSSSGRPTSSRPRSTTSPRCCSKPWPWSPSCCSPSCSTGAPRRSRSPPFPVSILSTAIIFHLMGLSINTMTLGGLAIAIGELVDDAVVDVENIFRRLRENREQGNPRSVFDVVVSASNEVRSGIVYATLIIVLVFVPLFALSGIEGRLFAPLGQAYIISILASLVVSITLTPVMAYYMLPGLKRLEERESWLVRTLKRANRVAAGARLRTGSSCCMALAVVAVDRGGGRRRAAAARVPAALQRGHLHHQHAVQSRHLARRIQPRRPDRREAASSTCPRSRPSAGAPAAPSSMSMPKACTPPRSRST